MTNYSLDLKVRRQKNVPERLKNAMIISDHVRVVVNVNDVCMVLYITHTFAKVHCTLSFLRTISFMVPEKNLYEHRRLCEFNDYIL